MVVVMGQASWLDSNSTWLVSSHFCSAHWSKLEVVESIKLEKCLLVFGFCTLKYQPLPKLVIFTQICTQNCKVNFKHIETIQGWAGWCVAWHGSNFRQVWLCSAHNFWSFCPSLDSFHHPCHYWSVFLCILCSYAPMSEGAQLRII